ncbi:MAG: hypothetical protein KAU48_05725 [Candidatus Thorarchaeota archaeon]|nr:hypothetical protein [Candidatus Thorarchaeota archaeon]
MRESPICFKNMHLETNEDTAITDADSNKKKFTITRNPKDIIYMLLFIAFGLWIWAEFLLKSNIFGDLSSMCGPFLVLGGVCFIFTSPRNVRKAGALLGLLGSVVACYMFFTLQEMIHRGAYVYPPTNALLALVVSFLCLFISLAQVCKSL